MNEVRLSGVLGDITEQKSGTFLTAPLRFRESDEVLLLVVGEKIRAFGAFDTGDAIRVIGRLAVVNGGLGIFVDEAVFIRPRAQAHVPKRE